jgi:predicted alpha/beta-hydrolase family hydrolase
LLLLAHGAGAGMRHVFLETLSVELATVGVATFRYQFPYLQQGRRMPNPPAVLVQTVCSAFKHATTTLASDLPVIAGGKSLGGRMTSTAVSQHKLAAIRGIVFFGFPLHAPGKASNARAAHLFEVEKPMLFLQGTRDKLAELTMLKPVCAELGKRAQLHRIDEADHSFHVPKRTGRSDGEIVTELAAVTRAWADGLD